MAKPLSYGGLLCSLLDPSSTAFTHKKVVEFNKAGAIVWEYDPFPLGRIPHHEYTRLPNGNTLMLTTELSTASQITPIPVWDENVVEVDPQGNIVWEWSGLAHLGQMPVNVEGWQTLITPGATQVTLFHMNSVEYLPPNRWEATDPRFAAGNVLVSFRNINFVCVIDKSSGNIVWSIHNKTIGQHHARMLPPDSEGAGHILMFDNGGSAGAPPLKFRPYSRVIELHPISREIMWSYGGLRREPLFSGLMSSAQRLPNGNTLISEWARGYTREVARDGTVVWHYVTGKTYRAYRAPATWPTQAIRNFRW